MPEEKITQDVNNEILKVQRDNIKLEIKREKQKNSLKKPIFKLISTIITIGIATVGIIFILSIFMPSAVQNALKIFGLG